MSLQHLRFSTLLALAGVTLAATAALAEPARPQFQSQNHSAQGTGSAESTLVAPARPQYEAQNNFVPASSRTQVVAEPTSATGPMVSAIQPQSGEVGLQVRIQGSNLSGVTEVQFSGDRNATFKVVGDHELRVVVPEGARPGPIALVSPDNVVKTPVPFTVAYE
jgi:hypothetical protein